MKKKRCHSTPAAEKTRSGRNKTFVMDIKIMHTISLSPSFPRRSVDAYHIRDKRRRRPYRSPERAMDTRKTKPLDDWSHRSSPNTTPPWVQHTTLWKMYEVEKEKREDRRAIIFFFNRIRHRQWQQKNTKASTLDRSNPSGRNSEVHAYNRFDQFYNSV